MTAVASALTLMTSAVRATKVSETQIVAGNLAREGVEVVRALRDSNWLAGAAFDDGFVGAGNDYTAIPIFNPATSIWTLNFTPNAITDARAVVYRYSKSDPTVTQAALGLMIQNSGTTTPTDTVATQFRRLLRLNPLCASGSTYTIITTGTCSTAKIGVQVISTVQWSVSGATKSITLEERLMDWR